MVTFVRTDDAIDGDRFRAALLLPVLDDEVLEGAADTGGVIICHCGSARLGLRGCDCVMGLGDRFASSSRLVGESRTRLDWPGSKYITFEVTGSALLGGAGAATAWPRDRASLPKVDFIGDGRFAGDVFERILDGDMGAGAASLSGRDCGGFGNMENAGEGNIGDSMIVCGDVALRGCAVGVSLSPCSAITLSLMACSFSTAACRLLRRAESRLASRRFPNMTLYRSILMEGISTSKRRPFPADVDEAAGGALGFVGPDTPISFWRRRQSGSNGVALGGILGWTPVGACWNGSVFVRTMAGDLSGRLAEPLLPADVALLDRDIFDDVDSAVAVYMDFEKSTAGASGVWAALTSSGVLFLLNRLKSLRLPVLERFTVAGSVGGRRGGSDLTVGSCAGGPCCGIHAVERLDGM